MRKLTLELEKLEVESFATEADDGSHAGTVRAHSGPEDSVGCTYFCTCTCTLEGPSCPRCGTEPVTGEAEAAA